MTENHQQCSTGSGLMMDCALNISSILRRASRVYPEQQIVSRLNDGSIHRYTYTDFYGRVIRLMNVLRQLGVEQGDRVGTFAWNSYHHLELYYAVPAVGAVLHTINIRQFSDIRAATINHAQDKLIFVDRSLANSLAEIGGSIPCVQLFVIMEDLGAAPESTPQPFVEYEELLSASTESSYFADGDERSAACLCYTSGTTGEPKGVMYSHRSVYLHAMGSCMADSFGLSERSVILPVVPMFHVNAWGLPYAALLTGARLVLPGSHTVGRPLADLMATEKVTFSAGVPTVWTLLLQHLRQHYHDLSNLNTVIVGGSALPVSLIIEYKRDYGIDLIQVWGMTETSPIGTVSRVKTSLSSLQPEQQLQIRGTQGLPVPGVEIRICDDKGDELPWDGETAGDLQVRGPWVASSYYGDTADQSAFTDDGWFKTGDVATVSPLGYMQITDRQKDLIKSRGEWISSVALENAVVAHPDVLEAAVVSRLDDLRGEAPVVFIVLRDPGTPVNPGAVLDLLKQSFERWQIPRPSDVHTIEALPKTGVGKIDKKVLRRQLRSK